MAKVGPRSEEVLATVDFGWVVREALIAAPDWLDFGAVSGLRTDEEQAELYSQGRNANGEITAKSLVVTYKDGVKRKSNHQDLDGNGLGEAVDIVAFVGGRPTWDEREVEKRAAYIIGFAAARGVQLSGGVKWGWDQGHLEKA